MWTFNLLPRNFLQIAAVLLCLSFVPAMAAATADSMQPFDDAEAAELAERAEEPGGQVVGGALTNQQLTYVVIALATAVLILLIK